MSISVLKIMSIKHIIQILTAGALMLGTLCACSEKQLSRYIDPSIGTLRGGHVVVGPCAPYGMIKPSPDVQGCNPGWGDMSKPVEGFCQTHVSGTGGSPKYGNVLIMPFITGITEENHAAMRTEEIMKAGYYSTTLEESRIKVEITSGEKAAIYRITYPENAVTKGLEVDAGFVLKHRRRGGGQQCLGGEVTLVSPTEICGSTSAKGGWGSQAPYTVYFCIIPDTALSEAEAMERQSNFVFEEGGQQIHLCVGISFLSIEKARENAHTLDGKSFAQVQKELTGQWDELLSRFTISPKSSLKQKRMFYTALYHSMIMPSDRKGEWAKASADEDYYDDYFTLWDTYRCTLPLITLIDPDREVSLVNSLINIYRYDGFMPDGRNGNGNGSTQGSSNADIVIADAFVKGLEGIDYRTALDAMIKDATVPSAKEKTEGRVGLRWYNTIGYLPWGVSRAGSRTVDHTLCDYAISVVAEGLGESELAAQYRESSHKWLNLFRKDIEEDGIRGFIMPRDTLGNWLDSASVDRDSDGRPDTTFFFRPNTSFGGHWNSFFYEANSYETTLAVPHDMDILISECGGKEAFRERLDNFFGNNCCDTGNEPSFLSSCLYHWVGRPDLSSDIISRILEKDFGDGPDGIPGNDDSGAMSSWLAFHMAGLYPIAGTDRYIIHSPAVESSRLNNPGSKPFIIKAKGLSPENKYIVSASLNGKPHPVSTLTHKEIVSGGTLVLSMGPERADWGKEMQ